MDSTLGAATLQAKPHAVRLFSHLRHATRRAEVCGMFFSWANFSGSGSGLTFHRMSPATSGDRSTHRTPNANH